jgi:hypothetical protein
MKKREMWHVCHTREGKMLLEWGFPATPLRKVKVARRSSSRWEATLITLNIELNGDEGFL